MDRVMVRKGIVMTLDFIVAYEGGELDEEQVISGFQAGIDDGSVWLLQGCYGRQAAAFIKNGDCHAAV